ncbi:MAG: hypothetical protein K2R98_32050 [Gemmataceae bacterium]|nr:hypothetical protein [Gemmataceae bacterium]
MDRWMEWLLTTQVGRYRKRYGGSGHVWQGRYKAFPIEQDEHLQTVLRYAWSATPSAPTWWCGPRTGCGRASTNWSSRR